MDITLSDVVIPASVLTRYATAEVRILTNIGRYLQHAGLGTISSIVLPSGVLCLTCLMHQPCIFMTGCTIACSSRQKGPHGVTGEGFAISFIAVAAGWCVSSMLSITFWICSCTSGINMSSGKLLKICCSMGHAKDEGKSSSELSVLDSAG